MNWRIKPSRWLKKAQTKNGEMTNLLSDVFSFVVPSWLMEQTKA